MLKFAATVLAEACDPTRDSSTFFVKLSRRPGTLGRRVDVHPHQEAAGRLEYQGEIAARADASGCVFAVVAQEAA